MPQYITYLRVSTQQQGQSGLGLEAQRAAVRRYTEAGEVLAEYIEVESGRKASRPELEQALAHARRAKATLIIAKLDRLARNVYFVSKLLRDGVDFIACDNPHANKVMIQMMAVFAEFEADQISQRTRAALAAARARGVKLGGPDPRGAARRWSEQRAEANAPARAAAQALHEQGKTLLEVAAGLQAKGILTPRGLRSWSPKQVSRLLA